MTRFELGEPAHNDSLRKQCYNLLVGLALDEENHPLLLYFAVSEFILTNGFREKYEKTGIFRFSNATIAKCCKEIVDLLDIKPKATGFSGIMLPKYTTSFLTGIAK